MVDDVCESERQMITVECGTSPVYVGTADGEICLNAAGSWHLADCTYVAVGTNAAVQLGAVRDGAIVLVDFGGAIRVTEGPDIEGSAVFGFGLAVSSIGLVLGIRWVFRRMLSAASMGGAVE